MRAALHLNAMDSDIVWYRESSNPLFVCTMQRRRFSTLSHFTQFDGVDTRSAR